MDKFDLRHLYNMNQTDNQDFFNPNLDFYRSIHYKENRDLWHGLKIYARIWKKKLKTYICSKREEKFTNILYVTTECPLYTPKTNKLVSPIDYITEIQKQYPEIKTRLLIPLFVREDYTKAPKKIEIDTEKHFAEFERTTISTEFYITNKRFRVFLYKHTDESNIVIYGLYSPAFSNLKNPDEIKQFQNLATFLRAVREITKMLAKINFAPEIVHSEEIPFFMGSECEPKFPANIKVFQMFNQDFIKQDFLKQEPFWALINLADKQTIKKLCKDEYIQKCFSRLFNIPPKEIAARAQECLDLIYQNYTIFHKMHSDNTDNLGDFIFRKLNERTEKLFPGFLKKGSKYYYPAYNTISCADYWAVSSKSYYENLYGENTAPDDVMKLLIKTVDKSSYVSGGINEELFMPETGNKIYNRFNQNNYREERVKNKQTLIKEFSADRLKLDFIDKTLFGDDSVKVYGYLDSFYEAPLLYANPDTDTYGEGLDILFSSIFKLFEMNKNIQVIISARDGMKNDYIKPAVEFLHDNRIHMGRWVYIDGEVNLPKVLSSSDMFLATSRYLNTGMKHSLAMRYGCVPVVPRSGCYNDLVTDIYDNILEGNGFKTEKTLLREDGSSDVYTETLLKALELYNNSHASWNIIIKNCLKTTSGWDFRKLERYNRIYQEIL